MLINHICYDEYIHDHNIRFLSFWTPENYKEKVQTLGILSGGCKYNSKQLSP